MQDIIDYGDDGVIRMIYCEDVDNTVNSIIDYVEQRFDVLDDERDIIALLHEFREWGLAEEGDEISYYTCPSF